MTRAIVIHETGGPEVMRWEDISVGEPGAGQVRLRQTVCGVNYLDTYLRAGTHFVKPKLPAVLGVEAAGVIEAIGPGSEVSRSASASPTRSPRAPTPSCA